MKWFLIIAMIVGSYYVLMLSTTNMALNATQQLQNQYASADSIANNIANGRSINH